MRRYRVTAGPLEECVVYHEIYADQTFDFRQSIVFRRFDRCVFVRCTILLDGQTQQFAITNSEFEECDLVGLEASLARDVFFFGNVTRPPIEERFANLGVRMVEVLKLGKGSIVV